MWSGVDRIGIFPMWMLGMLNAMLDSMPARIRWSRILRAPDGRVWRDSVKSGTA